jgi:glycosyltransferase involved in cell wall biosynthesis
MKILFDCTFLDDKPTGIPVYFYSLIKNLVKTYPSDYYIIIVGHRYDVTGLSEILDGYNNYRIVKIICYDPLMPIISSFLMPFYLLWYNADVYHNPRFYGPFFKISKAKSVITVHDLYHKTVPELMHWKSNFLMNTFSDFAVRRADEVIVISNQTKLDVIKYLNVRENRLNLIYQAVDGDLVKSEDPIISEKVIDLELGQKKYILCVGTMFPSKGLKDLVLAYAEFLKKYKNEPDVKLIIAGKTTYYTEEILHLIRELNFLDDSIHVLGFVSKDELIYLYEHALMYVIPSHYEGFGLTPVEAMTFDCPVIARNGSSLVEVVADAGLLFDDVSHLAKQIHILSSDESLRFSIIERAKLHREKFTNNNRTKMTHEVYLK